MIAVRLLLVTLSSVTESLPSMVNLGTSASEMSYTTKVSLGLFDWLVAGQVMPINPASSVRGPSHVVSDKDWVMGRAILVRLKWA